MVSKDPSGSVVVAEKIKRLIDKFRWPLLGGLLLLLLLIAIAVINRGEPVADRPHLRIARENLWHLEDFIGKESRIVAFLDEMLHEIAKAADFELTVVSIPEALMFPGLNRGEFSGALMPVVPRSVNFQRYILSDPVFSFGPVLVVSSKSKALKLADLRKNAVIGVMRGTDVNFDVPTDRSWVFVPYDNLLIAFDNVAQGVLDGAIAKALPAYVYAHSLYKDKLRVATVPLTQAAFRLVAASTPLGQQTIDLFNRGLKQLREKGAILELMKRWDLIDPGIPPELEKDIAF